MLKRFIPYYKPHKLMFTLDMVASLLISLIGMVYPMVTNRMLNDLIPNRLYRDIVIAGVVVLGLYILRMLLRYFVQYYGHVMGVRMQKQMRSDLFAHLQQLPYSFFDNHETGSIMTRLTSDLFEVSELAHHGPENLFICAVMIIGSFAYLCTIDVFLTLIIFACVPIMVTVSVAMRKQMRSAFNDRRKSNAVINASIESSITGIRVTKAFTNAEKEMEKFEAGNEQYVQACRKAYRAMAAFFSSTSFITDVFNVIILIAGGLFLYNDRINFADYSTFIVSVNLFINPVNTLINFVEQYQNGGSGFRRFLEIMDEPVEEERNDAQSLTKPQGHIALKDVCFRYDDSREVLEHIDLNIAKGDILALVGPSGGGKTTICHLLPRFYRPTSGTIEIDGQDISGLTLESLRKNIGIVQQDVFLFNGSIRDNILYGRLDATEEEVIAAAKRANIHDYVMTLPEGYDTQIGERGVRLSGGQKQRLSISRALLKDADILIFDDSTSALDLKTEAKLYEALRTKYKHLTKIIIAQRIASVKGANRIAVLDGGSIVACDSHENLMKTCEIYQDIYQSQLKNNPAEAEGGVQA